MIKKILWKFYTFTSVIFSTLFFYFLISFPYGIAKTPNGFRMQGVMLHEGKLYAPGREAIFDEGEEVVPPDIACIKWMDDAVYGYREHIETYRRIYFFYSRKDKKLMEFADNEKEFDAFLAQNGERPFWHGGCWTFPELKRY